MSITFTPTKILEILERRHRMIFRARGDRWLQERNSIFQTEQGRCTCEFTVAMTAHTSPTKTHARQKYYHGRGRVSTMFNTIWDPFTTWLLLGELDMYIKWNSSIMKYHKLYDLFIKISITDKSVLVEIFRFSSKDREQEWVESDVVAHNFNPSALKGENTYEFRAS